MAVPSDSKLILKSLLCAYADASKDGDLRLTIGTPGYRIEVRNETQDTGQGYVVPGFIDGVLYAVGALMDRRAGDEFAVTNPLGQSSFTLTQMPRAISLFRAFKNGLVLKSSDYEVAGKVVSVTGAFGDWFLFDYWY
jgi:hypothetical protein